MNMNDNYILNNSNLIRIINFCLLKFNLTSYYQKNANFEKTLYDINMKDYKNEDEAFNWNFFLKKALFKFYS